MRDGRVNVAIVPSNLWSIAVYLLQQEYQRTAYFVENRVELHDAGGEAAAFPFQGMLCGCVK